MTTLSSVKEAVKQLLLRCRVPHWILWPVRAGDSLFFDGAGEGRCLEVSGNDLLVKFNWREQPMWLPKEWCYYMQPEDENGN